VDGTPPCPGADCLVFAPPLNGWTHNSNWVALTLTSDARVTIVVRPDVPTICLFYTQPVACNPATGRTDSDLWPGISLYKNQNTTATQWHQFNPTGNKDNFFWAPTPTLPTSPGNPPYGPSGGGGPSVTYLDSSYQSDPFTHTLTYTKKLKAGQYTLVIGGAVALINPSCNVATTNGSPTLPPVCLYGRSYRAFITTSRKTW